MDFNKKRMRIRMIFLKTYENFNDDNNFKSWFGKSKMVDDNGNPKVFYHGVGSEGKFDIFDEDLIGSTSGNAGHFGKGFYFTDSKKGAENFSIMYGGTGEVISVYLKIENPFIVNEKNIIKIGEKYNLNLPKKVNVSIDIEDLLIQLKKKDKIAFELLSLIHKHKDYSKGWEEFISNYNDEIPESNIGFDLNTVSDWYEDTQYERYGNTVSGYTIEELQSIGIEPKFKQDYTEDIHMHYLTDLGQSSDNWTNAIKKEGYDGIVAGDEFVVFKPNQIKSVGNKRTYDINSDNIYESNDVYNDVYTMYSGISMKNYNKIWKGKNLVDRLTNVTSDIDFAFDYSYDFKIGKYDDIVIEISNIPIDAFVSYREEGYEDDDDFESMESFSDIEKDNIISAESLFLVDLLPFKDIINIKLIKLNESMFNVDDIKTPKEILDYINELHKVGYDEKEYEDEVWINKFDKYVLENIELSKLRISALHPPIVKKYSLLETEMPPIVVDSESMFILDGNHRAKAKEINGEEFIKAYVGYKNISENVSIENDLYNIDFPYGLKNIPKKVRLYRIFGLENIEDIYYNNLGNHYVGDYNLLNDDNFLISIGFIEEELEELEFKIVTIETDSSNIDINETIKNRESAPNEYEYTLKDNSDYIVIDNINESINEIINLAPNGEVSLLNNYLYNYVRTEEFKKWFGDWENDKINSSKILDKNGEPLLVYNGSKENFTKFDKWKGRFDYIYFTTDYNYAKQYGEVKSCFLNARKILDATKVGTNPITASRLFKLIGFELDSLYRNWLRDAKDKFWHYLRTNTEMYNNLRWRNYDSVHLYEDYNEDNFEGVFEIYTVFGESQINIVDVEK